MPEPPTGVVVVVAPLLPANALPPRCPTQRRQHQQPRKSRLCPAALHVPACMPSGGPPTEVMRGGQQANEAGRHREPGESWQMGRLRRLSHQSSPTACTATLRRLPTMLGRANDGERQPPICHPAWAIRAASLPSYPFRPWGIRASCLFLKHS